MKIFKKIVLFFMAAMPAFICMAQQKKITIDRHQAVCNYNLDNGKINGDYTSYYFNGNKKAKGKLINGYRTGKWIIWDSTGRKRMERFYKNPFEFTRIFPSVPDQGPIPLLIENKYKLHYDSGIVKYAVLKTEDAIWRHKYWRNVLPENNQLLFANNRLFNLFKKLSSSAQIELYDAIDDRFTLPIKKEALKNLFDTVTVVGFELKEENIFDMNRLVSEYRILGISPLVKINGQIKNLFWVYYPDMRKYLGKELVKEKTNSAAVKTLDDLFIFREFSSTIIKTTVDNPYDFFIKSYPGMKEKDIPREQEIQELIIIEAENDIWLELTK